MNRMFGRILLLLLFALNVHAQSASDFLDITSRFTYCWGGGETMTRNSDGSITFHGQQWGGLAAWIGGEDWTNYDQLVFELAAPSPCVVQPLVLYGEGVENDHHYMSAGTEKAYVDLTLSKRHYVNQIALQTGQAGTVTVKRAYLRLAHLPDYGEQPGQLQINEIMQSNIDCLMDELNDFPDSWVELYNASEKPVNLGKYKLGLTTVAAEAWQLPQMTVEPGQFVVVYADKVGKGLHTSFRLDSGKGALYLFLNGEVDDELKKIAKQPAPNIAYGRKSEGATKWGYQQVPTPGAPNCGVLNTDLLGDPVFSEQGRVLTDASPLTLTLSLPEGAPEGTVIRYTTDCSEPTATSAAYTQPLQISKSTVVRAKLMCDGYLSPRSTTQSYLFLPRELTLPVVSLATDNRYWDDAKLGILANNSSSQRNNWRRPVNIEYFEGTDTKAILNQLGETRVQGGATRSAAHKSLAIYANKRFGTKRFGYEFFPDQRPGETDFKSLILRNSGNDFDGLYMRDAIIQRVMGQHVDLDWQAWRPAIIFRNGVYQGMLNIRERANEDNVYTHYDGLEDIDMFENWYELKEGDWDNYNRFKAFYQTDGHTMAEYEQWMDCTEFANLMLMNMYFINQDFPGNNIVMWRPRAEGGRWRFIAKDTDFGLGLYGRPADYKIINWMYDHNYDPSTSWANGPEHTLLFRQLMADTQFRNMFIDRAAIYMGDFLNERGIRAVWDPMYEMIKTEYPYHRELINKYWPNYAEELAAARNWVAVRTGYFYQQIADYYNLGDPVPLTINTVNAEEHPEVPIPATTMNNVPLSTGVFDGMFFAGRQFVLRPETGVTGWKMTLMTVEDKLVEQEIPVAQFTLPMPKCKWLSLEAIIDETTGITTLQQSSRQWTWRVEGDQLTLRQVEPGTQICLYDLRGILLQRTVSNGSSVQLPLNANSLYMLKVGDECIKINRSNQ